MDVVKDANFIETAAKAYLQQSIIHGAIRLEHSRSEFSHDGRLARGGATRLARAGIISFYEYNNWKPLPASIGFFLPEKPDLSQECDPETMKTRMDTLSLQELHYVFQHQGEYGFHFAEIGNIRGMEERILPVADDDYNSELYNWWISDADLESNRESVQIKHKAKKLRLESLRDFYHSSKMELADVDPDLADITTLIEKKYITSKMVEPLGSDEQIDMSRLESVIDNIIEDKNKKTRKIANLVKAIHLRRVDRTIGDFLDLMEEIGSIDHATLDVELCTTKKLEEEKETLQERADGMTDRLAFLKKLQKLFDEHGGWEKFREKMLEEHWSPKAKQALLASGEIIPASPHKKKTRRVIKRKK